MSKPKLPKMMKPDTPAWRRMELEVLRNYAGYPYPCVHCGGPVLPRYCCGRCGSADPSNKDSDCFIPERN